MVVTLENAFEHTLLGLLLDFLPSLSLPGNSKMSGRLFLPWEETFWTTAWALCRSDFALGSTVRVGDVAGLYALF